MANPYGHVGSTNIGTWQSLIEVSTVRGPLERSVLFNLRSNTTLVVAAAITMA